MKAICNIYGYSVRQLTALRMFLCFLPGFLLFACRSAGDLPAYSSDRLTIERIHKNVYRHVFSLDAGSFGRVACNGMIVTNKGEALIFDTPGDDTTALELIHWVQDRLGCRIIAVIPTHFHDDCLGSLDAFHRQGIASYGEARTVALARENKKAIPQHPFQDSLQLSVGGRPVQVQYFGAGHTRDNVVGYFPAGQILFGGCLIKAMGADKGNLEDADVEAWSPTVARIRKTYPDLRLVIPGHGAVGGPELLDFTIALFERY